MKIYIILYIILFHFIKSTISSCGNGIIEVGELCDDGNLKVNKFS